MNITTKAKREELIAQVEPLRQQVESWRQTRTVNEHMPESLWDAATQLAKRYGVSPVQGILRIDYRGLRRRTLGLVATTSPPKVAAKFVELPPLTSARRPDYTVEVEDGTGRKLTVKGGGGPLSDLVPLLQTFWGGRG